MNTSELAPAKVNLTLHVTGRRTDGYHLLDSLVAFTQVGDLVSLTNSEGLTISGPEGRGLDAGADNLVTRAAALMGCVDAGLHLEKRLPVASGIGGGSADAAAALRLLARARGMSVPDTLNLGADVPVCLHSQPARMRGIGEALSPVPPLPPVWLVLVNPRVAVSTPDVFRALAGQFGAPMPDTMPHWRDADELAQWLAALRNDLQSAACTLAPVITQALALVATQSGCLLARMSGSGATCFGVFGTQQAAERAAQGIEQSRPDWWVQATGLLGAA